MSSFCESRLLGTYLGTLGNDIGTFKCVETEREVERKCRRQSGFGLGCSESDVALLSPCKAQTQPRNPPTYLAKLPIQGQGDHAAHKILICTKELQADVWS